MILCKQLREFPIFSIDFYNLKEGLKERKNNE